MTAKINVLVIITEHFSTFKDESTQKYSKVDFCVMLVLPATLSIIVSLSGYHIRDDYIGALISAFAIFSGLLFNVLVLIYSITGSDGEKDDMLVRLVRQTFANISFAIMSCLLAVVLLTVLFFIDGSIQLMIEPIIYFVGMNFMLTMLMVLKRMHVLMRGCE
ncbi:MAG: hypothetical protein NXI17_16110 [Alphaproteobacteria bacterium]|nr:hypothetical protein [Alphaproteobacteria bacterium]